MDGVRGAKDASGRNKGSGSTDWGRSLLRKSERKQEGPYCNKGPQNSRDENGYGL